MKKLSRSEMKMLNGGKRDPNSNGCPSIPQCYTNNDCYNYPYPIGATPVCISCINELNSPSNRCGYIIDPD